VQILKDILKSVAFACYRDRDEKLRYAGTVFFVHGEKDNELDLAYAFTITAKHVILLIKERSKDQKALLNVNLLDGDSDYVETNVEDWIFHPDSERPTDVALLTWSPPLDKFDWRSTPISMAATASDLEKGLISLGNELIIVGLFRGFHGKHRNQPIIRIGNI